MTDDTLGLLASALGQVEGTIAAIRPERQGELPTPCPQWTVRDLVEHLVGQDLRNFIASTRGETVDWTAPAQPLGGDWAAQARDATASLQAAWDGVDLEAPDPTGGLPTMRDRVDQQITELTVHTWDLTAALGVTDVVSGETGEALAEHALAWARTVLLPEYRGPDKAIGDEVPVPADAPAPARLAGFFGRDPAWQPPA